jgi:polyhydroxyalkanoate synthesis repressor PhaR
MSEMEEREQVIAAERRVIKRYSNRKLYDTADSRYVTLQQIGEMVRRGEDVQIIDNKTKEDKTEVTLALILSEDLKNKPRSVPLGTLRTLIQERGERVLSSLRDGPLGRLIAKSEDEHDEEAPEDGSGTAEAPVEAKDEAKPGEAPRPARGRLEELVESSRHSLEHLQATLDERVRAAVPGMALIRELRAEVTALTRRVEAIEAHLGISAPEDGGD